MSQAIQEIMRFQIDRGLPEQEFTVLNENTNIVEELLEAEGLDVAKEDRPKLRSAWRKFSNSLHFNGVCTKVKDMTKEKVVDAYCDIIVFSVGAIMKLGYNPEKALEECAKEINSRKGKMIDGKFEKDLSEAAIAEQYNADYSLAKV